MILNNALVPQAECFIYSFWEMNTCHWLHRCAHYNLRPVHTSKFKRIRCASNANWSRSHCGLSDAHQLNAHSMRIESIHFKMWFQCASNRIAWAIPEVMNNELVHALERWLLGRRHDLTIFRSSRSWLLAVFLDHKRCCRSSITGENNTTRALARDQSAILIVFPVSSVNALDAHSIRINSERFPIGANAHHNRL